MRCFATSTLHTHFTPSRSRGMCQLMVCYLLWCRTLGLLHRFCQWCILPHWLGSHISNILSDKCELITRAFDIRHRRFGPRTHSGSPVWWTHVTCCTAVNQHELSAGANPGQQNTTNLECVSVVQQLHPSFSAQPRPRNVTRWPLATNPSTDRIGYRTSTTSNVTFAGCMIGGTCI